MDQQMEQEAQGAAPGQALTPESVRANMSLPPELQDAYDRVVTAGMKIMFSDETFDSALGMLQGEGPVEKRLGEAITMLMGLVYKESNGTLPPPVIIPAATELLVAAGDFLKQSGLEPVTDKQMADAAGIMLQTLLRKFGVEEGQIAEMLGGQFEPTGQQAPGGAAGEMPPAPRPEPRGGGGGLVGGAMTSAEDGDVDEDDDEEMEQ